MTAQEMWDAFQPDGGEAKWEAWSYGVQPDLLARLTLEGVKTATASALRFYEQEQAPLPGEGDYSVVLDARGQAVCIIRTQKVSVRPFRKVTAEHAWKEGEGDRTLAGWRKAHEDFFRAELEAAGEEFSLDMPVVCEEFGVVYPHPSQ